ncbi:DUF6891 domain-containing protein [Streptomyces sp. NPDC014894]|uniref:DUF6891 domain-containing protein n=1 Tax=Streptomyces sp. NPDC014894 TaxID=3364931 RepID=UPI003700EC8A
MLEITVMTEGRERHVRPRQGLLDDLVRRIGGDGDRYLVAQRIPDLPEVFLQVRRSEGGPYTLEYREGPRPAPLLGTRVTDADGVIAAAAGWARREEGWNAGPWWTPVNLGPAPEPAPEPAGQEGAELTALIREKLVAGFATREELVAAALEFRAASADGEPGAADGEGEGARAERIWGLVDRLWLERVAEQSAWEGETDPERITRAFAALESAGITAREHFACCRGCGLAEIPDAGAPGARGFVFFHEQCAESAADGGLSLLYGGFDGSAGTSAAVGREVAEALTAVGLSTEWDGDPGTRILVPLDWRKRLVG